MTESEDIAEVRRLLIRRLIDVLSQDNPKASALAVAARFLGAVGEAKAPSVLSRNLGEMLARVPRFEDARSTRDDDPPEPPGRPSERFARIDRSRLPN